MADDRLGDDEAAYQFVPVPHWKRALGAFAILAVGLALFCVVFIGSLGRLWIAAFLILGATGWVAWKAYEEGATRELARNPDGSLTDAAARVEAERLDAAERSRTKPVAAANETIWESRWYVRYPIAALICWGAVVLAQNQHPWMAGGAVVLAASVAYEASALLATLGVGVLLWHGIASLPISAAIIIGAVIIASAVARR